MSTEKRSAEKQVEDEANLRARNPNALKQKISEIQSAPEFGENHKRLRAERLSREAVERPILYPSPELPDDTPLDQVQFPARIRNAISAAGWNTVGEIREASDATLLSLQDLGKGSVNHLRETLGLRSADGVRPHTKKPAQ
jgi:DNA-directed RNA polymerase alpha subunit